MLPRICRWLTPGHRLVPREYFPHCGSVASLQALTLVFRKNLQGLFCFLKHFYTLPQTPGTGDCCGPELISNLFLPQRPQHRAVAAHLSIMEKIISQVRPWSGLPAALSPRWPRACSSGHRGSPEVALSLAATSSSCSALPLEACALVTGLPFLEGADFSCSGSHFFLCLCRLLQREKPLPHLRHRCTLGTKLGSWYFLRCTVSSCFCRKCLLQARQEKGLSPVCVRMCAVKHRSCLHA